MKRYQENKTKITDKFNKRSKKVYGTIIYPKIERHEQDFYIDVLVEDRLDNLAYQYYEDVTLWWVIANANKLGIGKGSMFVEPGQRIRIPHPGRVSEILNRYRIMLEERTYDLPDIELPEGNEAPTNSSGVGSSGGGGY